jgi:prevent-host-death family protein
MSIKIECSEAKLRWSELLVSIQDGGRYTITLRGVPIAELVPVEDSKHFDADTAVDEMLSFMQTQESASGIDLKILRSEGRL